MSESEKNAPRMVKVHEQMNHLTVQEIVDFCLQRGYGLDECVMTGGHLAYTRPETGAEAARRAHWAAEQDKRTAAWEKETYVRLREKFAGHDK